MRYDRMCVGAGTITYFIPTLTANLGYEGNKAQFMTVPVSFHFHSSYLLSMILTIVASLPIDLRCNTCNRSTSRLSLIHSLHTLGD